MDVTFSYDTFYCFELKPTWQDKEDSRDEGQNSALRTDVSNITQHKANEHEE